MHFLPAAYFIVQKIKEHDHKMNKNQAQTQIQDCAKLEVENIQFECCSHTDQFAAFKFSEPRWQISEAPFSTTWQPSGIIVFRQAGPELCWLSHRRNTNRVTLPELPLFIVGTCEQALSKTSIQRSWFSFFLRDLKKYLWSRIFFRRRCNTSSVT